MTKSQINILSITLLACAVMLAISAFIAFENDEYTLFTLAAVLAIVFAGAAIFIRKGEKSIDKGSKLINKSQASILSLSLLLIGGILFSLILVPAIDDGLFDYTWDFEKAKKDKISIADLKDVAQSQSKADKFIKKYSKRKLEPSLSDFTRNIKKDYIYIIIGVVLTGAGLFIKKGNYE